jgi:1-acyl-sn-glycerol-3-phosphate acyltransferase
MHRKPLVLLGRRTASIVLRFLLWIMLDIRIHAANNVPAHGAGIVYYNHIHWLDPVIICAKLKRYAIPLTKIEARSWPVVGLLLRWYHVIFITRGVVDRAALKATWDVLAAGDISVIAPEGTRSPDGRLQTAKEGLAFVAREAPDAWLIPCAVTGTPQFKWHFPLVNRPVIHLTYGKPFKLRWPRDENGALALPEGRAAREVMREMTDEAMVQLAAVLPPDMQGSYADRDAAQREWLLAEG